jgi:hypothetical protein
MCYHIAMVHKSFFLHHPRWVFYVVLGIFLALSVSCAPIEPPPTFTLAPTLRPTPTPAPTSTPLPTPTVTPIPPLELSIRWPDQVSALAEVPVEVELIPPPGVNVTATLRAAVLGPGGEPRWSFDLVSREGYLYAADEPLQLPLEPPEGDWLLVVYVRSTLEVAGKRHLAFRPTPIRFRDLAAVLPAGVSMRVPQDFIEVAAEGDLWAGVRAWHFGGSEIALWWAPGPTEPLSLSNAIVILEATHAPENPPVVSGSEETEWQGQMAFLFHEDWPPDQPGASEALVVQGPDHWLYVLRVRTAGSKDIPPLMRQVRATFAFIED